MTIGPLLGRPCSACFAIAAVLWFALATPAWAGANQGVTAYERGDYAAAMRILQPLAEANDAHAQYHLGAMYEGGLGVEQDYGRALEWYRRAAQQGLVRSQHHLGLLYEIGEGVARDYAEAAEWHRRAAEQGYAPAQSSLARLYLDGLGTKPDLVLAHVWSSLAVLRGIQSAERHRVKASIQMTRSELDKATALAKEWVQRFGQ